MLCSSPASSFACCCADCLLVSQFRIMCSRAQAVLILNFVTGIVLLIVSSVMARRSASPLSAASACCRVFRRHIGHMSPPDAPHRAISPLQHALPKTKPLDDRLRPLYRFFPGFCLAHGLGHVASGRTGSTGHPFAWCVRKVVLCCPRIPLSPGLFEAPKAGQKMCIPEILAISTGGADRRHFLCAAECPLSCPPRPGTRPGRTFSCWCSTASCT